MAFKVPRHCSPITHLAFTDDVIIFANGGAASLNQRPDFENDTYPNHVFKCSKVLYGLKQALRIWYERLSDFLVVNGFKRGIMDTTLFTKQNFNDLLIMQIYVNDINFCTTNVCLCKDFFTIMQNEFEMSMMGELNFFLGLRVLQT